MESPKKPLARRDLLRGVGALGLGAMTAREAMASQGALEAERPNAIRDQLLMKSCALTPAAIQGPYYLNLQLMRKDITEGKPGIPTFVYLRIVDESCAPISGAIVDLWHNEALGPYSGFPSEGTAGETWLRGIQVTRANGIVCFRTVYPGWYPGRTTHMHLKVHINNQTQLTTQLYFPDVLSDRVYTKTPYDQHGPKPTTNATDAFFLAETLMATLEPADLTGVLAGLTITVLG